MSETKKILEKLNETCSFPTREDIKIFLSEVKIGYPELWAFINHLDIQTKETYASFLEGNIKDHRIQGVVSYIICFDYYRLNLLSFEHLKSLYNIVDIYDPASIPMLWFYIKNTDQTIEDLMWSYVITPDKTEKNEFWDRAKAIAKDFSDYEEMSANTLGLSSHALEGLDFMVSAAKTDKQKQVVSKRKEELGQE